MAEVGECGASVMRRLLRSLSRHRGVGRLDYLQVIAMTAAIDDARISLASAEDPATSSEDLAAIEATVEIQIDHFAKTRQ